MILLTPQEAAELERFRKRREAFGDELSVANVHNVPDLFPVLYKRIFRTDSPANDLFCLTGPNYSDQDSAVVQTYEQALRDGYEVLTDG